MSHHLTSLYPASHHFNSPRSASLRFTSPHFTHLTSLHPTSPDFINSYHLTPTRHPTLSHLTSKFTTPHFTSPHLTSPYPPRHNITMFSLPWCHITIVIFNLTSLISTFESIWSSNTISFTTPSHNFAVVCTSLLPTFSITPSLISIHSLTHSLTCLPARPPARPPACRSLADSLTHHSPTPLHSTPLHSIRSLAHSLTHSLTHSVSSLWWIQ